jgi:hypothetical protein
VIRSRELLLFLAGAAIVGLHLADVADGAAAYGVAPPGARAALAGPLAPLVFFGAWCTAAAAIATGFAATR